MVIILFRKISSAMTNLSKEEKREEMAKRNVEMLLYRIKNDQLGPVNRSIYFSFPF